MTTSAKPPLIGAIEGGGTKFIAAVGSGPGERLLARAEFATGDAPTNLIAKVIEWLHSQEKVHGPLAAIGIASFGPVDLTKSSPTYGFITSTPKPGWQNTDLVGPVRRAFPGRPVGFDTDTNGAALGELTWGNAVDYPDFVYITIGTGIGGGVMSGGQLVHGLVHPEMGHMALPRLPRDEFEGGCPFHGRCWEGLCSGPAMRLRTGAAPESLPANHPAWRQVTEYTGIALINILYMMSPRKIVLGGSVPKGGNFGEAAFFDAVRSQVQVGLNRYIVSPAIEGKAIRDYIVPAGLGDDAGVCGAIALGLAALKQV